VTNVAGIAGVRAQILVLHNEGVEPGRAVQIALYGFDPDHTEAPRRQHQVVRRDGIRLYIPELFDLNCRACGNRAAIAA
jgi:hypothetical protein